MFKVVLVSAIILLLTETMFAQSDFRHYKDSDMVCEYQVNDGCLDGIYASWYPNGRKKARGIFKSNCRYGKWIVWDSSGMVKVSRNYSDHFHFFSEDSILNYQYNLQKNQDGYIDYFEVKENMIVIAKRVWRVLLPDNNPMLFRNDALKTNIFKNLRTGNYVAFNSTDDAFTKALKREELDTLNKQIISYKIKEDYFFDSIRKIGEYRIIGICPVVYDTLKKDTSDLCWLYFPSLRKFLAQEEFIDRGVPDEINNFDDLFFYRFFASSIYKESNVYDREISDYIQGDEIRKEAERIELGIIEMENDLWLKFLH